jgi:hypothetical protein
MDSVYFRTKFWDGKTVRQLKPNEKYVYFYLITNNKTKPSGIYKFYIEEHLKRTGLNEKTFKKYIDILRDKKKIIMFDDWIFVIKFLKETFNLPQKTLSKHVKKAIEKQFGAGNVPLEIIACFHSVYHTLLIPYPYPIDTILGFRLEILDFRLEIIDKNTCGVSDEFFEEFWKIYPARNNRKLYKAEAREQMDKIRKEDLDSVLAAANNYANSRDVREGVGIKDACRWIRDGCWKEWLEEEQDQAKPKPKEEKPKNIDNEKRYYFSILNHGLETDNPDYKITQEQYNYFWDKLEKVTTVDELKAWESEYFERETQQEEIPF